MAATMLTVTEEQEGEKVECLPTSKQFKPTNSKPTIVQKIKEISTEPLNVNDSGLAYSLLIDSKRPSRLPTSSVLSRVKSFLPAMKAANEELMVNTEESDVGLELPDDYEGPAIQMDLTRFAFSSSDDSSDEDDPPITEHNIQTSLSVSNHRPSIEVLAATDSEQASCTQSPEGVANEDCTVK